MKEKPRRFKEMTDAELIALAGDTSIFDRQFIADRAKPLTPAMRRRWQRAKRRRGRPRQGRGAKVIAVSIERGLLAESDALARKRKMTRAALIARGLRVLLAAEGMGAGR